jgi:hypothetical protein
MSARHRVKGEPVRPKNALAAKLAEMLLTEPSSKAAQVFDQEFKDAFLATGSESPDNLSCVNYVEYGSVADASWGVKTTYGLKLKRHNAMLSDIMNVLENCEMPPEIRQRFPGITGEEWDAATRMMTMILVSLERDVAPE